jgi:glutamate/tyrosine decarboxylase-like PLP-dependent enzyme
MIHGAGAFRRALAERLEMAQRVYERLENEEVECLGAPELSAFGFRLPRRTGEALASWNTRNQRFMNRINERRRVHLSSTLLPGADGEVFTLRVCVVSFRTTDADLDHLVDDIRASLPQP